MKTFKEYILESEKKDIIAVDLDGTLAHYTKYVEGQVGKPIPKMLKRVQKWIEEGKTVIIFTARANNPKDIKGIKKWLKDNNLPNLKITNVKTPDMTQFYDDRAIGVEKNTGEISHIEEGLMKKIAPIATAVGLGAASVYTPYKLFTPQYKMSATEEQNIRKNASQRLQSEIESKRKEQEKIEQQSKKIEQQTQTTQKTSTTKNIQNKFNVFIDAIAKKETGHLKNPNLAIGDQGRAFGKYQIHKSAVQDVNKIHGTNYKHSDMFDPQKARDVLIKYLKYWGNYHKKRTGQEPTYYQLAAMWNGGGPNGIRNKKALAYAKDVVSYMK